MGEAVRSRHQAAGRHQDGSSGGGQLTDRLHQSDADPDEPVRRATARPTSDSSRGGHPVGSFRPSSPSSRRPSASRPEGIVANTSSGRP
jgi:hypothetical protein